MLLIILSKNADVIHVGVALEGRDKWAYLEAGSMAVDLHLRQDHLGGAIKGLAAMGAQVFLRQDSASQKCYNITGKLFALTV